MIQKTDRIFVAGGFRGLVGSAIVRRLQSAGYINIFAPSSLELDLSDQRKTFKFYDKVKPDYVFVAAAKVGGIWANSNMPAEYCYENLCIQNNVIHGAYLSGVKKLMFLGSSCMYPTNCEIPIKESSIFTGPLEKTNEGYAAAKSIGVRLCEYYRKQYGCDFITVVPTNTFGPNDNFDLRTSHMVAALIHKFYLAKQNRHESITIWGTGKPRRELMFVDDVADGCVFLMNNYSAAEAINLGSGSDYPIEEIALILKKISGFEGDLNFDTSKPDGVFRKVMDVSKITELGWAPKFSLEAGLKEAYTWFDLNYHSLPIHPSYSKKSYLIKDNQMSASIKRMLINPKMLNRSLDTPETMRLHREVILSKPFLQRVYKMHYRDFEDVFNKHAKEPGISLELGSGGGFLKKILPEVLTSDIIPFDGVDRIEKAYNLTFKDGELKTIYMTGVLHHLGRVREFLKEADRCLRPGGKIVMMEPHMSWFGRFFFKILHHENNDLNTKSWEFPQEGPLSDANTALPYIIFDRDVSIFESEFPTLKIVSRKYHTFLLYGLSGGVGFRFSMPSWSFPFFNAIEKILQPAMKKFLGTMQTIVVEKVR